MSLLLLMEELGLISRKIAYLGETGSHHGWYTHMLGHADPSKNVIGDQSRGTSKEADIIRKLFGRPESPTLLWSSCKCRTIQSPNFA